MHSTRDICYDVCLPRDVVNGNVIFLESVQPSDLAGGRLGHGLEVLQCRADGIHDDWQPCKYCLHLVVDSTSIKSSFSCTW